MSASVASGTSSLPSTHDTNSKGSTHRSMKTSKSDTVIPDFNQIHNNYAKALVRGRHPNSFPKESELWHHFRTSSERVKKISFGADIWEVVQEQEHLYAEHKRAQLKAQSEQVAKVQEVIAMPAAHQNASQMRTINGVQVDMKSQVPMHYGMVFIIMNMLEEVLCVNKWDEVKCKPIQNIDTTDRICFKILHLGDPTNPGVLKYGSPMWLQLWDHGESGDNAWQNSFVLAAKPFGPPEMGGMDIDIVWGKSGSKDKDKDKETATGIATNPVVTNSPPRSAASTRLPRITTPSSQSSRPPTSATASSPAPTNREGVGRDEEGTPAGNANPDGKEETVEISPVQTIGFVSDRNSIDNESLAAIIGDLQPVRVVDKRVGESDAVLSGPRSHTKTSWYMGQWVGRLATRSKLKTDVIFTQSPIYMEQDLYCLATGHGTGFRPWPKSSAEIEFREASFPKLVHLGAPSSRSTTFENMNRMMGLVRTTTKTDRLIGGSTNPAVGPSATGNAPTNANTPSTATTDNATKPLHRDVGEYGCVRKVSIRGPPYKNLVDRRCVWKFCAVDTQGDIQSLSVKDQITQRLMNRARVELRKSEQNRKGICIHKGYEYRGQPLTRGEGFTRTLRAIILQNTHNLELDDMKARREKEKHLRRHFSDMLVLEEEFFDDEEDYTDDENEHQLDDATENSLVSGLSDDHYTPYKVGVGGTERWDEAALSGSGQLPFKPSSRGGSRSGSRGGSRQTAKFMELMGKTGSDTSTRKKKKKSSSSSHNRSSVKGKGGDDDATVSTVAAESILEQAFHVDKFIPAYLPMKPLAYSQPKYDHPEEARVQSRAPARRRSGAVSNKSEDVEEESDEVLNPNDFGSVLSHELDSVAATHSMPLHQFYGPGGVPIVDEVAPQAPAPVVSQHPVIHVPSHPLGHHFGGGKHHGHSHHVHSSDASSIKSNGSVVSDGTQAQQQPQVVLSRDGTRKLALDHHIDLFQSDGERVVAIFDMMDYVTTKTANEAKHGERSLDATGNASTHGSLGVTSPAPSGPNITPNKKTLSRLSSIGGEVPTEGGSTIHTSLSSKIAKLQQQDENLCKVLVHRESLAQYNRLTQLFQDLKAI